MMTPMILGTAPASRRPIMVSAAKCRIDDAASLFAELAKIKLAVKPVLIPGDIFLHSNIQIGLIERHAWHLVRSDGNEITHQALMPSGVGGEARLIDQLVQGGILIRHGVKNGVLAMIAPEEKILWIVQPTTKGIDNQWHVFLQQGTTPVGTGDLVDRCLDADLFKG